MTTTSPVCIPASAAGDPAATDTTTCNTDDGIRTTAQVDWDFTIIDANDSALTTVGFPTVVQEIVDRAGWVSGNALLIHIFDDGNTDKLQVVASYESSYTEPTISIDYTVVTTVTPATVNAVATIPTATAYSTVGGVTIDFTLLAQRTINHTLLAERTIDITLPAP